MSDYGSLIHRITGGDGVSNLDSRSDAWRRLLHVLPNEIVIVDEHGIIRHVSESLEVLTGYSRDELLGEPVERLVPPTARDGHEANRFKSSHGPHTRPMDVDRSYFLRCRDGRELDVAIALSPITLEDAPWVIATIHQRFDHTAQQRQAFESASNQMVVQLEFAAILAESEERFRHAFEDNMTPMVFSDLNDRIVSVNDAFAQLIGRSRDELIGLDSSVFTHPDDLEITPSVRRSMHRGITDELRYTKRYQHADGRLITVEVSRSVARDVSGETIYHVIFVRDITQQERRARVLELRSEVNRFIATATNTEKYLQQLCEVIVEKGGYALAWVGVPSRDQEGGVDVLCAAGATNYLHDGTGPPWWGSADSGLGPTGTALRTGMSQTVGNLSVDGPFEPWRDRAAMFGFGSSIAIANLLDEQPAVLTIYDHHVFAFDPTTIGGFEEIVQDARFAAAQVRSRDRLHAALEEATVTNAALIETEQRFRLAFEDNMAPMIFTNLDNQVIAANDAFCQLIGYAREEILGRTTSHYTHPDDVEVSGDPQRRLVSGEVDKVSFVKRYVSKDGRLIVINSLKSAARGPGGEILYFVSSQRDITEERALTEQLSHQALHDPLTGLANRALFDDRLAQATARVQRHGGFGAVLLLDLDDFKGVNDTYGHLVGDQLLVGVAHRLERVTRSSDTLCRFGGDEFLYLAEGMTSPEQADDVARRLLNTLAEPFTFSDTVLEQRASIGVVVCDGTAPDFNECVREADVALYEAKRLRRGRHLVFHPDMQKQAIRRFSLIQELRLALQAGDLAMHYQPIVDLVTHEVVGFESLMRWRHASQGWIPPTVFIPLAEQSELILELGALALREALGAAATWRRADDQGPAPFVTVNLSAHQFHDPGLITMVEAALIASQFPPERLVIEITESVALLDAAETMNTVASLNQLGIDIALDDFGTGYSSLSYLALWQPRIIKIDRSFVSPVVESDLNSTLLEAIISLGLKLKTTVLAEGIETRAQLELLSGLECRLGQGYLFSPAVPAPEVSGLLTRGAGDWWADEPST